MDARGRLMVQPFTAEDLQAALTELAERLRRRGARASLYVVGGAAMILAHGAAHATRDIDAAIEGDYQAVTAAVLAIARERSWPTTWLNEQATLYMPSPDRRESVTVLEHPHLVVAAASAAQMLAMKARAARRADVGDLRRLARITGIRTVEGVEELIAAAFPAKPLGDRQRQWLGAVLGATPPRGAHRR